jgi:hypothetical protein
LIGVVDVQVQPATAEDFCENITRGGDTLTGGATDTNSEGLPHRFHLQGGPAKSLFVSLCVRQAPAGVRDLIPSTKSRRLDGFFLNADQNTPD